MKVIGSKVSGSVIASQIDLFSDQNKLPKDVKEKIRDEVGNYLLEQILKEVGDAKSPVTGSAFPKLDPKYAKKKKAEGGQPIANLELYGDMLPELTFKPTRYGIEVGIYGDQAPKADGHNNFSGKSRLPERRFLPDEGQGFISKIEDTVQNIIDDIVSSNIVPKKADFEHVATQKDLYSVLSDYFGDLSKSELRAAALANSDLMSLLDSEDLTVLL